MEDLQRSTKNTPRKKYKSSTQVQLAENRLKLANTQLLIKQSLTTVQDDQPQPNQPKCKQLKTALANEAHNLELTHQIILNSQSQCSKQGGSLQSIGKTQFNHVLNATKHGIRFVLFQTVRSPPQSNGHTTNVHNKNTLGK